MQQNIDLRPYNTFGIHVFADLFAPFSSVSELRTLIEKHKSKPLLILGGGSNVLFTKDVEGLVLKNEIKGYTLVREDAHHVWIKVGAGEIWHEFVLKSIALNLSGVENLSLIPGSVGASPMQNIGAYGVEIKDVFHELEAYHIPSGELHTFDKAACKFGYRESVFKQELKGQYVITSVTYQLNKAASLNVHYGAIEDELKSAGIVNPTIKDVSDAVIRIRRSKLPDPATLGNAGSFFKNPVVSLNTLRAIQKKFPNVPHYPVDDDHVKLAAGWLIEQAGWKGKRVGECGVHDRQALVLVNYKDATGTEVLRLSSDIIDDIENKFGVTLEREVNIR